MCGNETVNRQSLPPPPEGLEWERTLLTGSPGPQIADDDLACGASPTCGRRTDPVVPSIFNVRVPLPDGDVFLLNTLTDAQARVSSEVAALVDRLAADSAAPDGLTAPEREAVATLTEQGFLVSDRAAERASLEEWFHDFREDASQLRVTVLTTLQCNFACGYCIQGDHGDYNARAHKMSLDTAARVAGWVEERLDALGPRTFVLTFFGGEPLLNLPAVYALAERLWDAARTRGVTMSINVITNGLLLTPDVVDRLVPLGLNGVKVTLDGDREAHNHSRPLRGGQGTFDRIVDNLRRVAGRCSIAIGGNFDAAFVDRYPALLAFLREQPFASSISKVAFKPVIRSRPAPAAPRIIPLRPVAAGGEALGGACMTAAGSGGHSPCDGCHFVDEHMAFLREETRRHGFPTPDGVHMGPCEIHRRHAYTIGPDGALYACPGFSGDASEAVGHIAGGADPAHAAAAARFERLAAWRQCGDCAFIPVCGGGCTAASHHELCDMNAPTCHKHGFETALVSLAHETAGTAEVAS
jgi:uncharacterized protein